MPNETRITVDCTTGEVAEVELSNDEQAELDAGRTAAAEQQHQVEAAAAGDEERLALISERAANDPAFAALAELLLRGR